MDFAPGDVVICVRSNVVSGTNGHFGLAFADPLREGARYTVDRYFGVRGPCRACGRDECEPLQVAGVRGWYCPSRFTKRPPEREALFRSWQEPVDFHEPVSLEDA